MKADRGVRGGKLVDNSRDDCQMVPLHRGTFGQPSLSSVGMDSQSNVLVGKWKKSHYLEKAHKEFQVLNIELGIVCFGERKQEKNYMEQIS